uniref:Uncharacterized protein n=1 Tax=Tanacetum cinerariifolium TaxID=118510 RepID=A0A699VJ22_TANCI|nr:hypothetical protein [Tanacetum cinerariifolium]
MIAAELSQYILIGLFIECITPRSPINFLIQTASVAASEAATYSACAECIAIVVCFLLFQSTAPPLTTKT